jgi:hypothetical protein
MNIKTITDNMEKGTYYRVGEAYGGRIYVQLRTIGRVIDTKYIPVWFTYADYYKCAFSPLELFHATEEELELGKIMGTLRSM